MASLIEALIPADQAADASARKSDPVCNISGGKSRAGSYFSPLPGKLGKQLGFFERLLTDRLAFRPQSSELGHVLFDGAVDALLIQREQLEISLLARR
jgi:hypothetical protein